MSDVDMGRTATEAPPRQSGFEQRQGVERPASPVTAGRSIATLIKELGADSSRLVREEIALAKAEMREKLEVYRRSTARMAVGGALLLAAMLVVLVAVNRGLTALLAQAMDLEVAVWLAPLMLAVVFGLIGWSLVRRGKEEMAAEGLTPRATMETIREEKRWVQEEMR
jgi:hypothetical protein